MRELIRTENVKWVGGKGDAPEYGGGMVTKAQLVRGNHALGERTVEAGGWKQGSRRTIWTGALESGTDGGRQI